MPLCVLCNRVADLRLFCLEQPRREVAEVLASDLPLVSKPGYSMQTHFQSSAGFRILFLCSFGNMQNTNDPEFLELTRNRADSYAMFARLFLEEISPELLDRLRRKWQGPDDPEAGGEDRLALGHYLSVTKPLGEDRVLADLAADYAGLFLNAGRRPAYPYESVYTSPNRLLMQKAQDDVRHIYAAAGLSRSGGCREPEDHIAFEMEFMSHLCRCTVAAVEQGKLEEAHIHLQNQRKFLENHLLVWAPQFCEDVILNASTDFYRGLACLVRDFLAFEKDLIDPDP